ncbi:hypothetical protein Ancab_025252 [Ancistrocladus abbreviatus]
MKRSTVVTEVIARERTLEYRTVRQQRDIIKHFSHPHALREYEFHEHYCMVFQVRLVVVPNVISTSISRALKLQESSGIEVMNQDDHQHALALYYSLPYYNYSGEEYCAVCRYAIGERSWVYGCCKCKYWCHSDCVLGEATSTWADLGRNIGGVIGGITDGVIGVTGGIIGGLIGG